MVKTELDIEENIEAALCYVFVWVGGLIFYIVDNKNKNIRFHALQSIFIFFPLTILAWIFGGFFGLVGYGPAFYFFAWISWLFWLLVFVLWVVLIIKALQNKKWKAPIAGDWAERNS